ncbi:MAG: methenyltetrahydromethanopterin cyclohydrolase, partial [Smithellaceae bacterium]|nr:methenyltetrahydromethanopterin cyclohydrolase [Smithellaceae bacterium]
MIRMNELSYKIAHVMADEAEMLKIAVENLPCGATLIDAGVNVTGSLEAGRLFSEACLGGLGKVNIGCLDFDGVSVPGVSVTVSHPVEACMAAQYAGWLIEIKREGQKSYRAMGSGPARLLYGKETLLQGLGLKEQSERAVLLLESRELPGEDVAIWVANKCGVSPDMVVLLVAPTASLVGSVQVAARVVETGMHKMFEVG